MDRREFVKRFVLFFPAGAALMREALPAWAAHEPAQKKAAGAFPVPGYDPSRHFYGMDIQVDKCIGCGSCVEACKTENDVPRDSYVTRTWVEKYAIKADKRVEVESITGRATKFDDPHDDTDVLRSFFVPKLCNHCVHAPCVQVCPVGATFLTEDGVVLVDAERCVGCAYCIQACPYGARYLHPTEHVADKCTFCYHRVVRGNLPACVEVCPTQARIFGDLKSRASQLARFERMNKIHVLKAHLNTEPKVYYSDLDGEVR